MPSTLTAHSGAIRRTRTISMEQPWQWLTSGWRDMMQNPVASLSYGVIFAGLGYMIFFGLAALDMGYLAVPLALGFTLVGPLAAIGLYHISRRAEMGQPTSFGESLMAWRINHGQVALMGMVLLLCFIAWARFAALLFMLFFGDAPPALDMLAANIITSPQGGVFLVVGFGFGAILAFCVFTISVVSVPMLLDRDVDAITAVLTSIDAVRHNFKAMLLWAWLVAMFTFSGMMLMFLGLIIALPLIGHASWHAYRDLVE